MPTGGIDTISLESELRCLTCGYALRGLPRAGTCPECGFSVEDSVAKQWMPQWRRFHRLRRRWFIMFLGELALVAGCLAIVAQYSANTDLLRSKGAWVPCSLLPYSLLFWWLGRPARRWLCPRCGQCCSRSGFFHWPLRKACAHCRLPLDTPGPETDA